MKKSYLIVPIVLMLAISAQAIDRDLLVSRQVERLIGVLSLTDKQAEGVRSILTKEVETALESERQSPPGKQQPGNRGSGKDVRIKINALLDDNQRTSLRELNDQIVPSRRLLELNERLGLNEEQVAQVEEILAITRPERRAMQPEGADRSGGDREAMKQMHDQQDAQIEEVLTNDQKALFTRMKKESKQQRTNDRPPRKQKP